ncbi:MAG TPA: 4Fe-4S binding protein, partial [Nitrospirae bacterium]|nr:4Fe-4S binding protein [Nitrospirota bacterium]
MSGILNYRYMLLRRATSIGTLVLFFGANAYGWTLLKGNLSYADLIGGVPLADPFHILQVLVSLQVPAAEALLGAAFVLVFYAAVAGRAFCSWVCPVNMVSDATGWLRRKTGFVETLTMSRSTRYWALGLTLALSALMGIAAFEWIS